MAGDAFIGKGFGSFNRPTEFGIQVNVPDIPLWVPERAQAILHELMGDTLRLALAEVGGRVGDEAQKFADTGNLAQSFQAYPATSTGGIDMVAHTGGSADELSGRVFSSLPYAVVMNDGRLPGRPISRVGIEAIGLWAKRKLGLSDDEAERAKFAIARSIQAQGIEGKGYFEAGVQAATPRVEAMFGILGDQLATALTKVGGATGKTGTV